MDEEKSDLDQVNLSPEDALFCLCDIPDTQIMICELKHIKCQALLVGEKQLKRLQDDYVTWDLNVRKNKVRRFGGFRYRTFYYTILAIILGYLVFYFGELRGMTSCPNRYHYSSGNAMYSEECIIGKTYVF